MHYRHREFFLNFSLILFCCLFVAVTRAEVPGESQGTCIVPFWESPPKDSWLQYEQVAVRIDDAWNSTERGYFQQGIEQWNLASNCSYVTFYDYSSIHFTSYNDAPPDYTLWWQKRSPVGVLYFFKSPVLLQRLRAVIVPIPANFVNNISNSYFVYLGTHEVGHTFDLGDCIAANNCQQVAGTCSIMGGQSQNPAFNTGGPLSADNDAVDVVYCPQPCPQYCDPECSQCIPADPCTYPNSDYCPQGWYRPTRDSGCCLPASPILIDVDGNGFNLTNGENGVLFDLLANGLPRRFAWTSAGSDDAWLVLDRNNNGTIDSGAELFGNFSPQPTPPSGSERNGFLALAEYDKLANGGNGDGKITNNDSIFGSLRLWQDINNNGVSEPSELHTLVQAGLTVIDLDYQEAKKTDQYGNQFRYRAKVKDAQGSQLGHWAWDVFLVAQ